MWKLYNCRLCGTEPYVPKPVDGGDHKHYQIICCNCGIEVINIDEHINAIIWNRLMGDYTNE